jgi:hypothetical protein
VPEMDLDGMHIFSAVISVVEFTNEPTWLSKANMREKLEIQTFHQTDVPIVSVNPDAVWDLVEYLSWQRVAVNYSYEGGHFVVRFTRSDRATAQKFVDEWYTSEEATPKGDGVNYHSDAWLVGCHKASRN